MKNRIINPDSLARPIGYNHGILAPLSHDRKILLIAGQVAWDKNYKIVGKDFVGQFEQALKNVLQILKEANGKPENITKMNIYVTNKKEYLASLKKLGVVYRKLMDKHFPAMTLVEVKGLVEKDAKLEIEAIAVI